MPRLFLTHIRGSDLKVSLHFPVEMFGGSARLMIRQSTCLIFVFRGGAVSYEASIVEPRWITQAHCKSAELRLKRFIDLKKKKILKSDNSFTVHWPARFGDHRQVGTGAVLELLDPLYYRYEADAELVITATDGTSTLASLDGEILRFTDKDNADRSWLGHLNHDHYLLEVGRAFVCLHCLTLSQSDRGTSDRPFQIGDELSIFHRSKKIGIGRVSRQIKGGVLTANLSEPHQSR